MSPDFLERAAADRPVAPVSDAELSAMHRAAALAGRAAGRTSPNPPVGAVILAPDGRILGQGFTQPHGQAHAEVRALAAAGMAARGATAVVTLEPCNHTGSTGPCSQALLAAGIARVVYAIDDPNPVAAGGAAQLRAEGVEVLGGVESSLVAAGAIRAWMHAVTHNRPYVTWKFASTLDGRSAAADGSSQWITNPMSRADVHALRAVVDAIVVGSGTVLADDPQLTARPVSEDKPDDKPDDKHDDKQDDEPDEPGVETEARRQPLRVVLDRRGRVPNTARIFDDAAETLVLDTAVPRFALKALFDRGVRHVLLEGGPTLAGAFLEARCVDEVIAYLAPKLLGSGSPALAEAGITTIADAVSLDVSEVIQLGGDVKIVGRPVWSVSQES